MHCPITRLRKKRLRGILLFFVLTTCLSAGVLYGAAVPISIPQYESWSLIHGLFLDEDFGQTVKQMPETPAEQTVAQWEDSIENALRGHYALMTSA